jgi:hypothetical protein
MSADGKMQFAVRPDHPQFAELPLYIDVFVEVLA